MCPAGYAEAMTSARWNIDSQGTIQASGDSSWWYEGESVVITFNEGYHATVNGKLDSNNYFEADNLEAHTAGGLDLGPVQRSQVKAVTIGGKAVAYGAF